MKKVTSLWMAAARNLWWKLLLILILMTAAEVGLFYWAHGALNYEYEGLARADFAWVVEKGRLKLVFFAALAAVTACCVWQGCRFSGKNVYTLQRLSLPEWQITALWVPVHLSCFVILWAVQVVDILLLWKLFAAMESPAAPGLELVTALYRTGLLHAMLPLADGTRWVSMLTYWVSMSVLTAAFGFFQRRGRYRITLPLALGFFFQLAVKAGHSGTDIAFTICCVLLVGIDLAGIWGTCHEAETQTN